ncbi:hypothetical protein C8R46DRAFT_1212486 [Mycena filopes]|nr:hypothetical protein C8R46DRAFT_1212486 [Mycena filopes]
MPSLPNEHWPFRLHIRLQMASFVHSSLSFLLGAKVCVYIRGAGPNLVSPSVEAVGTTGRPEMPNIDTLRGEVDRTTSSWTIDEYIPWIAYNRITIKLTFPDCQALDAFLFALSYVRLSDFMETRSPSTIPLTERRLTQRDLDHFVETRAALYCTARISVLPMELLSTIFLFLPDSGGQLPTFGSTLLPLRVCSEWRSVAMGAPSLWRTPPTFTFHSSHFHRGGGFRTLLWFWLERAKSSKIALSIRVFNTLPSEISHLLGSQPNPFTAVRSLNLICTWWSLFSGRLDSPSPPSRALRSAFVANYPALRDLTVHLNLFDHGLQHLIQRSTALPEFQSPSVQRLRSFTVVTSTLFTAQTLADKFIKTSPNWIVRMVLLDDCDFKLFGESPLLESFRMALGTAAPLEASIGRMKYVGLCWDSSTFSSCFAAIAQTPQTSTSNTTSVILKYLAGGFLANNVTVNLVGQRSVAHNCVNATYLAPRRPVSGELKWGSSSHYAQQRIDAQLHAYNKYRVERITLVHVPRLVDMTAELLALQSPEAFESINTTIISNYLWGWTRAPYTVFRKLVSDPQQGYYPTSNGFATAIAIEANIFLGSAVCRTIVRAKDLPGFTLMCAAREDQIAIQPSTSAFHKKFESMSHGLLQNLDWANVLVAGGMVLGTLVTVDTPEADADLRYRWSSSDIDVYLYGLSADKATAKIHHIYETFRSNLPSRTPTIAVRNSTTITFYARDVLLNFDLDICAMGWDGKNVWMLPRAARALETGYNTFTMSLVNGHYLSDRRASQPKRIFKYADRGYGVRILPSYLSSLAHIFENEQSIDVTQMAADAHLFVENMFRDSHRVRYSDLDDSWPTRSCLTTFTLFMRHAVYWEVARRQDEIIDTVWADVSYEETYEDNPDNVLNRPGYKWDSSFSLSALKDHVAHSNDKEVQGWIRSDYSDRLLGYGVRHGDELDGRRMSCATRIDVLLGETHDIKTVLFLPSAFAVYANTLVNIVLEELVQPQGPMLTPAIANADTVNLNNGKEGLFVWTITSTLMWQQQDRRIDELFDVLRAFCRVNTPILSNQHLQAERLVREVSKRGIGVRNELESFRLWVRGF